MKNKITLPKDWKQYSRSIPEGVEVEKTVNLTATDGDVQTLYLTDIIGDYYGITYEDVVQSLESFDRSKPLQVKINSPGGVVYDAIAIYNELVEWPSDLTTYVTGIAASAATIIAQAGDTRKIAENASYMIHNAWSIAIGNSKEMRVVADLLDQVNDNIVEMYVAGTGRTRGEITSWMDGRDGEDGTTFTAADAVKFGFADELSEQKRKKKDESYNGNQRRVTAKIKVLQTRIDNASRGA